MSSIFFHTIKLITWDLVKDFIYFPVWWYTDGLQRAWDYFVVTLFSWQHRLGLGIWIKNWFKPMYAQYDLQGRLISFFFRTLTIVWKTIEFFVGFFFIITGFLLYLLLPIVSIGLLLYTLFV